MKWTVKGEGWGSGEGNRNKREDEGTRRNSGKSSTQSLPGVTVDFTISKGNQQLAPSLTLAASAVLISGAASVSNFQEEPLEITMFNSLSWPPGILPPSSATARKAGGWKEEGASEEGRENKMVLVRFKVCLPFSPAYMPHPQR